MSQRESLGSVMRRIRFERDWTLAQMSTAVSIPISSLAKIERDQLSLTYDKLLQLSEALQISLLDLFCIPSAPQSSTGRRSVTGEANTVTVVSKNYDDNYLCSELLKKVMTPIVVDVKAANIEEFGPLTVHEGEEFIYVLSGSILVYTSFYGPTLVNEGGGHYLDSQMGHAYVRAEGCESASILMICAGKAESIAQAALEAAAETTEEVPGPAPVVEKSGPRRRTAITARPRTRTARR